MKSGSKKDAEGCVKCGTCNTVCPVYLTTGNEIHTPRGKQHLGARLQKGERSAHYADIFSKCLLCGACLEVCPRDLDTPRLVLDIRSDLPKISGRSFLKYVSSKALAHPALFSGLTRAGTVANNLIGEFLPVESGLRLRLAGFEKRVLQLPDVSYITSVKNDLAAQKKPLREKQTYDVNYFTGCLANYLQPEIAESTQYLVSKTTRSKANVVLDQTCCGLAAKGAGRPKETLELAKKNIRAFEENDLPILTSCSSCYFQLKTYNDLFADDPEWKKRARHFSWRLLEFSTFFLEKFSDNRKEMCSPEKSSGLKVFYHDPCHLRFKLHITEEPRRLLKQFHGVDVQEMPGGPQCCGQGGLFQLAHPDLALQVRQRLMDDFSALTAQTVVTACSGCLLQWQLGLETGVSSCQAKHMSVFIAKLIR